MPAANRGILGPVRMGNSHSWLSCIPYEKSCFLNAVLCDTVMMGLIETLVMMRAKRSELLSCD